MFIRVKILSWWLIFVAFARAPLSRGVTLHLGKSSMVET